jgi:hypothetical protein
VFLHLREPLFSRQKSSLNLGEFSTTTRLAVAIFARSPGSAPVLHVYDGYTLSASMMPARARYYGAVFRWRLLGA